MAIRKKIRKTLEEFVKLVARAAIVSKRCLNVQYYERNFADQKLPSFIVFISIYVLDKRLFYFKDCLF